MNGFNPLPYKPKTDMSEVEWMDDFARNLRDIMAEKGVTQEDLADDTGLNQTTISRYLGAKIMPTAKALVNISYALHVELDELMDFGFMIR